MNSQQAEKRIQSLIQLLNQYSYEYYVLNQSTVRDEVFDALKNELKDLETQFPQFLKSYSPTQRVGGVAEDAFQKVVHSTPMLSIEDIFTEQELYEWEDFLRNASSATTFQYFCDTKIDGLAISLRYERGELIQAVTRGNGVEGEDVTHNARTIRSIPLKVDVWQRNVKDIGVFLDQPFEVRGEIFISLHDFTHLNQQRKKQEQTPFANPRNLAAGSVRQLDASVASSRPLSFCAYDVVSDYAFATHSQKHQILRSLGFPVDEQPRECRSIDEVIRFWREREKNRAKNQTPADGVVVRVNDMVLFRELGETAKSPRGMRALKFSSHTATTRVVRITTQVGRTGVITPVADLEPVLLNGVRIRRATLHNEEEIERLDVREGDTVVLERAGDVIPSIVEVVMSLRPQRTRQFSMPQVCPVCSTEVVRSSEEVAVRCPNTKCVSQVERAVMYFASRNNFDIDGMGDRTVRQLIEAGLIRNVADIFSLTKQDVEGLERFSDKSASNLIDAIERSKKIPFARFLSSLNIMHIGQEIAYDLSKHFATFEELCDATFEDLECIDGVGPVVARSFVEWWEDKENKQVVQRLFQQGVSIVYDRRQHDTFAGKRVVFTGTFATMSREQAQALVREHGGSVSSSVSRTTDFLVYGTGGGSKREKAEALAVPLMSEQEFLNLIQ